MNVIKFFTHLKHLNFWIFWMTFMQKETKTYLGNKLNDFDKVIEGNIFGRHNFWAFGKQAADDAL